MARCKALYESWMLVLLPCLLQSPQYYIDKMKKYCGKDYRAYYQNLPVIKNFILFYNNSYIIIFNK